MMSKKQKQIEELKRASAVMYEEYLKHVDKDKDQADYAWTMYQIYDKQIEQLENHR